jgi:hypothetical protein
VPTLRMPITDLDAAEKELVRDMWNAVAALETLSGELRQDPDLLWTMDRALLARWLSEIDQGLRSLLDEIREDELDEIAASWNAT